eukprot:10973649-Lingulodinium_polyedra.AAC.2
MGIWANLEAQDVKEYFILGVTGHPEFKYPLKKVDIDRWMEWCVENHERRGSPLTAVYPAIEMDQTCIDWDVSVGIYAFQFPKKEEKMEDDDIITHMLCRSTGTTVKLPSDIVVKYSEVGSTWALQKNYNFEDALLVNTKTKCTRPCQLLFGGQAAATLECCHFSAL